MIIGPRSYPTVHIPPYDASDDPTANIHFPLLTEMDDYEIPMDAFTSDHFRIYVFKVKRCARAKSHDWTECPYVHPGEKARRRDPRKFLYSGTACPDYKKGECVRGDACEYAHGVFECWLHPTRYRTQPCKDGVLCCRKICFFAHTADQLRLLPTGSPRNYDVFVTESDDELPTRIGGDSFKQKSFGMSPTSTLYALQNWSPPMSPCGSIGYNSVSELSESMRGLLIGKGSGGMSLSPRGVQTGSYFGSTRQCSMLRPGFSSLPVTPTRKVTRDGLGELMWDELCEEEPAMERVESGRDVRAKMYAKLKKENSLDRVGSIGSDYNSGWDSELVGEMG
ncbi:Zinc finger CCCH domain-containing protein 20 [Heracleum sosnowskyi]|uniref:Zinc finger CCCH domain-containing protein 20 n=1 Tax=Heracleum sosnowskyi TaxID=360622 RepID=A0AAD8MH12_9APIA|nr:Zinc finger CCCH domain-containing protein 20 [Heracleum sosnowskyi]